LKKNINKIKGILSKPQNVATGTISILIFTIISKALGFIREMVVAANFGTSWRLDALIVAMDPATTLGGIVTGAIASMMVPIYIGEKRKKDPEKITAYTTQILFISSLLLIGFGVLFSIFPELFVRIFAPKFSGEEFEYAVRKMRIIGFLPFIQGFHSLATSLLNAEKKYMLASMIQLVFNIVTIPSIIIFAPFFSEASYLFAFIIGTLGVDLALLYVLRKKINLKLITESFRNPAIRETIILALPLLLSGSLGIINGIVDKAFASSLDSGSISALRYAQTIRAMISSLIIGSLMTTVFTELSETSVNKNKIALENRLKKTSNDLLNFMVPLTFWMILMARNLIRLLYERGEFTSESTNMVTLAFIGYSMTLIISPVSNLLMKVFTSHRKTKIPLLITTISIILNFVFNSLLIKRFGILGLTLSTSFVSLVNLIVLNIIQKRTFDITFLKKRETVIILSSSIAVFTIFFLLKSHLNTVIWLILANSGFLVLFIYLNRKILFRIMTKIKRRLSHS
jgi:putative peptidoglycan lipid II flippase